MQIEFNAEEMNLLRELLDRAYADLREEGYKTEATDWKRAIKAQEQVLRALIAKLGRA